MPSKGDVSAPKRDRLTLSQLASYDDILTDTLVDKVYFWTTIRKNRSKYNLTRGIAEDDVTKILLYDLIIAKDTSKAESSLLRLSGLRKYIDKLSSQREKVDFKRHMRKYLSIWLPDCSFEVSTTNRYTIVTQEAAISARKFIKKGETIKYLVGNLVSMTPDEEKDLDLTRRDFSIVMSSRKKTPSLFLGPARFANHDCDANARLVTKGKEGMQVVAVRDIKRKEEITVTYGDDYFGIRNCECLCRTCELGARNGWGGAGVSTAQSSVASTPAVEEPPAGPYSFRNKRRHSSSSEFGPSSTTPNVDGESTAKRRKMDSPATNAASEVPIKRGRGRPRKQRASSGSGLRHELSIDNEAEKMNLNLAKEQFPSAVGDSEVVLMSTEDAPEVKVEELNDKADTQRALALSAVTAEVWDPINEPTTPPKQPTEISRVSESILAEDATSPLKQHSVPTPPITPIKIKEECIQSSNSPSEVESVFDECCVRSSTSATTPASGIENSEHWKSSGENAMRARLPTETSLSELSSAQSLDGNNQESTTATEPAPTESLPRQKRKYTRRTGRPPLPEPEAPSVRYPGDYVRTPRLLGESYSRWVDCQTCKACWVQPNGYYTRKECPRCERHSKLYGFQWPKTEPAGKGDDEERVLDHRTVHRFIGYVEEGMVRKRGRGVNGTSAVAGAGAGSGSGGLGGSEAAATPPPVLSEDTEHGYESEKAGIETMGEFLRQRRVRRRF